MQLTLLILGLIGLGLGANLVIKGAQNIARHFRISEFLIGLTAISIGTSLPEISVSVMGAINRLGGIETSGIVIGDKMGSLMSQITLILGIAGLSGLLVMKRRQLWREGAVLIGSLFLVYFMMFDLYLSRIEGIILILFYIIYFVYLWKSERKKEKIIDIEEKQLNIIKPKLEIFWDMVLLSAGIGLVVYASNTVVTAGSSIALLWGVPQSIVGILLVGAIGSSLPELVVSIQALRKRSASLSVGNLLGSNICDTLFSLGIGSTISGFMIEPGFLKLEIPLIILMTSLALLFFYTKKKMARWEAAILILFFISYVALKIFSIYLN